MGDAVDRRTSFPPSQVATHVLFQVLALATDLQAGLGSGRAREGLTMARGREQLRGRPPKLDQRQEHHIVGLYQTGDYTVREVGDLFNVSRSTVYRAVRRADRAPEMQPTLNTVAKTSDLFISAADCGQSSLHLDIVIM